MIEATRSGDMTGRIAAFEWTATPLGSRAAWTPSLGFAVEMILASAFPTALRWGHELVLIYNDAYAPMLGARHPAALGKSFAEAPPSSAGHSEAPERAILDGRSGGEVIDDLPLSLPQADGAVVFGYFAIRLSPLPDPVAAGGVGGVLITVSETTQRVRMEAALKATEVDLRIAVDAAGLGRWDHDLVNGEIYWDPRAIAGFTACPRA